MTNIAAFLSPEKTGEDGKETEMTELAANYADPSAEHASTVQKRLSLQQRMKASLAETGIPAKKIDVYGSQIVITSWSADAADKWAILLSNFAKVRGIVPSMDERHDAKPGTPTSKKYVHVYRTFATIQGAMS